MTMRAIGSRQDGQVEPLLDHLVYAVPDLDRAVEEFSRLTGVAPAPGGSHRGWGTRNHLVGLGGSRYLEIIGPDLENPPEPGTRMPFGIQDLTDARLTTWAVHPRDIDAVAACSAAAGADQGPVHAMQRVRPDGMLLRWRLAAAASPPMGGLAPFFIDWGDTEHPGEGELPAVDLLSLLGSHPDPPAVREVLDAIGVRLRMHPGSVGLSAVIQTPRGIVALA